EGGGDAVALRRARRPAPLGDGPHARPVQAGPLGQLLPAEAVFLAKLSDRPECRHGSALPPASVPPRGAGFQPSSGGGRLKTCPTQPLTSAGPCAIVRPGAPVSPARRAPCRERACGPC